MRIKDEQFYWLLVVPAFLTFVLLGLYPFAHTLYLSVRSGGAFVGLRNYAAVLGAHDGLLALKNTVVFVVGSVALEFAVGFASALIMNAAFRGRGLVRVVSFLPWAIPVVIAGIAVRLMLLDMGGIVNHALMGAGLIRYPVAWLANRKSAMVALILTDSWKSFPIMAFLLLAGLQQMPTELYEAAHIDGASSLRVFTHITLPLLRRVMLVALMIRAMQAVAYAFDMVYSLTRGGPGDSTQVLVSLARKYSFQFMQFEVGAAVAVLALLTSLALGGAFMIALIKGAAD